MKNLNISNLSKNSAQILEYKREWKNEYYLLTGLKITTSIISILSSYIYVYNLFYTFIPQLFVIPCTVIVLFLIEFFATLLTAKLFKFLLRKRVFNTIILTVLTVPVFVVSFVLSTNGIAQLATDKTSQITAISDVYTTEKSNLTQTYDSQISELKTQINTIKQSPQNWSNGKRNILSESQLQTIKEYQTKIFELQSEKKNELTRLNNDFAQQKNIDLSNTTSEADKYYYIVSIILIIQLVASFILAFMSKTIYKTDNIQNVISQDIEGVKQSILDKTTNILLEQTKLMTNTVLSAFEVANILETNTIPTISKTDISKKIGFKIPAAEPSATPTLNDCVITPTLNDRVITTKHIDNEYSICECCGAEYAKKTWNQRFCCSDCRVKSWESSHGAKIKFGKK